MTNGNKREDRYPKITRDITFKFESYLNKISDVNELGAMKESFFELDLERYL